MKLKPVVVQTNNGVQPVTINTKEEGREVQTVRNPSIEGSTSKGGCIFP